MKLHQTFRIATLLVALSLSNSVNAAIIGVYNLTGTAGSGLRPGNEPGTITGGTGGEIGSGLTLDDGGDADPNTNLLTVSNVAWGSSNGFVDLSSTATNSHIHGPTAANNGSGFTQTAGVLFSLTRSSSLVTGGVFTNAPIAYTAAQVTDLNNGKHYINIHTTNNGGGELRGFIVQVPEPTSIALLMVSGACAAFNRRKRS